MSGAGPSPHLSWRELACHDAIHTPYPLDWREVDRIRPLALVFEQVRQACGGKPITILSAYRTPAWNALVGGSPRSQHLYGRALDLQPPAHLNAAAFHAIVLEVARLSPHLGGVGLYDWGVHLDTRPRVQDALVRWDLRSPETVRV